MVYRNFALISLLIAAITTSALAGGSIFSGNGVGEELAGGGSRVQGLGGGGLALADSMGFNTDNPALAAFAARTLLRMSGEFAIWETSAGGLKDTDGQFVWKDFYVIFPVTRKWRVSVGAEPKTRMDLHTFVNHTANVDSATAVTYEERDTWSGSRVDLKLDNSLKVSDRLAVGLSIAYLLQRDERDRTLDLPQIGDSLYYADVSYSEIETFRGWTFGLGGYFAPTPKIGLGLVFRPQIGGNWDYKLNKGGGSSATRSRGGKTLGEIDLGVSYKLSDRFVTVADVQTGQWSAGSMGILADTAGTIKPENPLFVSAGFERLAGRAPAHTGFDTWGYRGGLYYRKHYWPLRNGVPVEDYGVTAGLSLPIAAHAGWLHFAAEGGLRGRDEVKLGAKEMFFRGSLELEMSETWFEKSHPRVPK